MAAPRRAVLLLLACVSLLMAGSSSGDRRLRELEAALERGEGLGSLSAPLRGRQLLQNPDRPALTNYSGYTMQQIIAKGYPLETHKVVTPDGWILNMHRIPHGAQRNTQPGKRPLVLLHHGITLSSACFTLLNANESLAYILADAGFDVWMANTRSNTFSRGNLRHSFRDVEYWQHSFTEYGLIDLKYQIEKMLDVTGAKKTAVVGHSQGSSVAYAMLSSLPEMNDKVSVVMHMGPVAFIDFFRAPFLRAMAQAGNDDILRQAQLGEFLWFRMLAPFLPQCRDYVWVETCVATLNVMFYGPSKFITPDDSAVILATWPASVSQRNMAHWAQMMTDGQLRFQRFDHGTNCSRVKKGLQETCNQIAYGSERPPEFNLGRITTPQVLLEGEIDLMSTPEDVAEQARRLKPGVLAADVVYTQYSHMDFVWDRNARHAVDMADIMFRFSPGTF